MHGLKQMGKKPYAVMLERGLTESNRYAAEARWISELDAMGFALLNSAKPPVNRTKPNRSRCPAFA